MINSVPEKDVILESEFENVWVLPSNMALAGAELELVDMDHRESRLKTALAPVKADFDFIFFDWPPSLGLITLNALCASDTVMVPIQCEDMRSKVCRSSCLPSGRSSASITR